ncbi:hypothetical protein P8452_61576 [Trifolium repens]|nr:hypothetical protein P8452_61576 [Trifolium repens]
MCFWFLRESQDLTWLERLWGNSCGFAGAQGIGFLCMQAKMVELTLQFHKTSILQEHKQNKMGLLEECMAGFQGELLLLVLDIIVADVVHCYSWFWRWCICFLVALSTSRLCCILLLGLCWEVPN